MRVQLPPPLLLLAFPAAVRACTDPTALNFGVSGAICSTVTPTFACNDPTAENYNSGKRCAHVTEHQVAHVRCMAL